MRRVLGCLVVSTLVAMLITGATFFVTEGVVSSIPGTHGKSESAVDSGFPVPYAALFCCGFGPGYSFSSNTTFYYPISLVADFAIWLAISLVTVFTFAFTRLVLAAVAGLGVTLLTLLLPPLSIVRPTPGLETSVLRPMGFPYSYLTYYIDEFGGVIHSGYQFAVSPALADYVFWAGVAAALIGIVVTVGRQRRSKLADSKLPPF